MLEIKVGVLSYRDYTPSGWDAETHTCTLLIHAAHDGPGSAISGAILLSEPHHQQEFHDYFRGWDIAPLPKQGNDRYRELGDWVGALDTREHADTVFYLAGYIPGVVDLRRQLRRKGFSGGQVKTQRFWD